MTSMTSQQIEEWFGKKCHFFNTINDGINDRSLTNDWWWKKANMFALNVNATKPDKIMLCRFAYSIHHQKWKDTVHLETVAKNNLVQKLNRLQVIDRLKKDFSRLETFCKKRKSGSDECTNVRATNLLQQKFNIVANSEGISWLKTAVESFCKEASSFDELIKSIDELREMTTCFIQNPLQGLMDLLEIADQNFKENVSYASKARDFLEQAWSHTINMENILMEVDCYKLEGNIKIITKTKNIVKVLIKSSEKFKARFQDTAKNFDNTFVDPKMIELVTNSLFERLHQSELLLKNQFVRLKTNKQFFFVKFHSKEQAKNNEMIDDNEEVPNDSSLLHNSTQVDGYCQSKCQNCGMSKEDLDELYKTIEEQRQIIIQLTDGKGKGAETSGAYYADNSKKLVKSQEDFDSSYAIALSLSKTQSMNYNKAQGGLKKNIQKIVWDEPPASQTSQAGPPPLPLAIPGPSGMQTRRSHYQIMPTLSPQYLQPHHVGSASKEDTRDTTLMNSPLFQGFEFIDSEQGSSTSSDIYSTREPQANNHQQSDIDLRPQRLKFTNEAWSSENKAKQLQTLESYQIPSGDVQFLKRNLDLSEDWVKKFDDLHVGGIIKKSAKYPDYQNSPAVLRKLLNSFEDIQELMWEYKDYSRGSLPKDDDNTQLKIFAFRLMSGYYPLARSKFDSLFKLWRTYQDERPRTGVAIIGLEDGLEKILVVQEVDKGGKKGLLGLPKGKLKLEESESRGAKRECEEEVGVIIHPHQVINVIKAGSIRIMVVQGRRESFTASVKKPEEIKEIR